MSDNACEMGPKCESGQAGKQWTGDPLSRKLTRFSLLTAGLSGFLVCGVLLLFESYDLKRDLAARLEEVADMGSASSASPLTARDQKAAEAVLRALTSARSVWSAGLYDRQGALFSGYSRPGATVGLPDAVPPLGTHEKGGVLWVVRPVRSGSDQAGSVCLVGGMSGLAEQVVWNLAGTVLALFVCLGASMLVLLRFLRATVQPILSLTRMARTVSQTRTYSLRASPGPNDEVGELVTAFNDMLRGHAAAAENGASRVSRIERLRSRGAVFERNR